MLLLDDNVVLKQRQSHKLEVPGSLLVNKTLSILLSVAFRPTETVWKEDFTP